ncbi:hypothetical protein Mame01_47920 [Microbispora amethystogenes]|nr:hypothetical protein Mame01_47920 [Microbispora amethystogenes]
MAGTPVADGRADAAAGTDRGRAGVEQPVRDKAVRKRAVMEKATSPEAAGRPPRGTGADPTA